MKKLRDFELLLNKLRYETRKRKIRVEYDLPEFKEKDTALSREVIQSALLRFLEIIAQSSLSWELKCFREFCEVSHLTFSLEGATRYKEGYIKKRSGGRHKHERK